MGAILPEIIFNEEGDEEAKYRAVADLRNSLELKLQEVANIQAINNSVVTVSATYDQTEIQQLSDAIKIVSDKVDLLLVGLE